MFVSIYSDKAERKHYDADPKKGTKERDVIRVTLRNGTTLGGTDLSGGTVYIPGSFHRRKDAYGEYEVSVPDDFDFDVRVPRRDDKGEFVRDDEGKVTYDSYELTGADLHEAAVSYHDLPSFIEVPAALRHQIDSLPVKRKDGTPLTDGATGAQLYAQSISIPYNTRVQTLENDLMVDVGGATFVANFAPDSRRGEGMCYVKHQPGAVVNLRMPMRDKKGAFVKDEEGHRVYQEEKVPVLASELARAVRKTLGEKRNRGPRMTDAQRQAREGARRSRP